MSLFGKLGKDLGVSNGVDIEDYMNSQEVERVFSHIIRRSNPTKDEINTLKAAFNKKKQN